MKLIKKLLIGYNFFLVLALSAQGIEMATSAVDYVLGLLLLPAILHFGLISIEKIKLFRPAFLKLGLDKIIKITTLLGLITTSLLFFSSVTGVVLLFEYTFVLLLLPLVLYFWIVNISSVLRTMKSTNVKKPFPSKNKTSKILPTDSIADNRRRGFLKLVGSTSVGLLLGSLFNPKQAGATFFGSVPGPGTVAIKDTDGTKVDPAIKSPTDAYGITEIDDSSPAYYGFINKAGAWYITQKDGDSFRYASGSSSFSTNWTGRAGLSYTYFDSTF